MCSYGTCISKSGEVLLDIKTKDACDGKTGFTYMEPLPWSVCSDGCQFGLNESKQACDSMDGYYTYVPT